ncbi:hypothetical protein EON65_08750 [archaeon]|nr:MAG: hypothetical protein EON65_08750 [archaeon]
MDIIISFDEYDLSSVVSQKRAMFHRQARMPSNRVWISRRKGWVRSTETALMPPQLHGVGLNGPAQLQNRLNVPHSKLFC